VINPSIEGIVENGRIRLLASPAHVYSPRLAHPEQARDFVKEVFEVSTDARL
jgi:hypothetical protein